MVSSITWMEVLERANFRCEWIYSDFTKCQNTMSLRGHHRTYERFGNERASDLSLLCPSHHLLADLIRKFEIGQREDVIADRISQILRQKFSHLDDITKHKFTSRLLRENDLYWNTRDTVMPIWKTIEEGTCKTRINDSEYEMALEERDWKKLLWHHKISRLCSNTQDDLIEFFDRVQSTLGIEA